MIAHDVIRPVKKVRTNTYYFCLMLVLAITQIETSIVFVFNLRLHIVPSDTRIICKSIGFLEVSRNPRPFSFLWARALVEAGVGQDSGSCIPPKLEMQYHKWEGSLFTSGLLNNFTKS